MVERDPAGVGVVDGGHDLVPHGDGREPRVRERLPQARVLGPDERLLLGIGHGAPIRGEQAIAQDLLEVGEIGDAQATPEIAGRDHPTSREHPDAEGERAIVARGLGGAVLGGGVSPFGDLEAHARVAKIGERRRPLGHEIVDHRLDAVDQLDLDVVRHGRLPLRTG